MNLVGSGQVIFAVKDLHETWLCYREVYYNQILRLLISTIIREMIPYCSKNPIRCSISHDPRLHDGELPGRGGSSPA